MEGISVIIACYNSEKVIATTLRHLQAQVGYEGISWEVILVNNNSTDQTAQVAESVWNENPIVPLQIILETAQGEANARKAGIKAGRYSILSVVDDDNWVAENWIKTVFSYFKNPEIGLVGCAGEGAFESKLPDWFEANQNAFAIGSLYPGDFVDITKDALVPGAGLNVRKAIYDHLYAIEWEPFLEGRVGNKQSAGADSEMCYITRYLGYKIYYSNQLKFKHFTAENRITWERLKNMTYGFGAADVFFLVYQINYAESEGQKTFLNTLRKKWWFNFLGKRIVLALKRGTFRDREQKELFEIRNQAFCETILTDKRRFEEGFAYLNSIPKIKDLR
jgi:glycosyltransferase involved in cell wall biosynthesis